MDPQYSHFIMPKRYKAYWNREINTIDFRNKQFFTNVTSMSISGIILHPIVISLSFLVLYTMSIVSNHNSQEYHIFARDIDVLSI